MASQAEVKKVRVALNGATAIIKGLCRKAVAKASFRKFFREPVEYISRSELETAIRCRDLKKISRVISACDQENVVRNVVKKMEGYPQKVLLSVDEVLLKAFVIYSTNKTVAEEAIKRLKSMRRYAKLAEIVEKEGIKERRNSCLSFLEENINAIAEEGVDSALLAVKRHTKKDDLKERVTRVLQSDINVRRGLKVLVEREEYGKIVALLVRGQLSGYAEQAMDLLERDIDKVIATGDVEVITFVLKTTRKAEITARIESKAPEVASIIRA